MCRTAAQPPTDKTPPTYDFLHTPHAPIILIIRPASLRRDSTQTPPGLTVALFLHRAAYIIHYLL